MTILEFIRNLRWWRTREEKRAAGKHRRGNIKAAIDSNLYGRILWRAHSQPGNVHAQEDLKVITALIIDAMNHPDVRCAGDIVPFYDAMDRVESEVKADLSKRQTKEAR